MSYLHVQQKGVTEPLRVVCVNTFNQGTEAFRVKLEHNKPNLHHDWCERVVPYFNTSIEAGWIVLPNEPQEVIHLLVVLVRSQDEAIKPVNFSKYNGDPLQQLLRSYLDGEVQHTNKNHGLQTMHDLMKQKGVLIHEVSLTKAIEDLRKSGGWRINDCWNLKQNCVGMVS